MAKPEMSPPALSPAQLQSARAAATKARRLRAELKQQIRDGNKTLAEAIDACINDEILQHIRVVDLLKALPRIGDKRAAEILRRYEIAANRRVRGLGRHQINGLKSEFN